MFRICILLILLAATGLSAQSRLELSDSARISLITVAPGDMLYSTFGHSALRVADPYRQFDRCYNYGTFDFDQPNFLLKFCRGKLLYFLNTEAYRSFEYSNLYELRPMQEQMLNLTPDARQRLFNLLEENAKEENRYYKYDFFYDNCATRIRNIVQETFFYQINFDSSQLPLGTTMRQLLWPFLREMPWTEFGIDLLLGTPADRVARPEDYMFLPAHMHDLFGSARLSNGQPLVTAEHPIPYYPIPKRPTIKPGFFDHPIWVTCLIALIGLLSMANPTSERIFDTLFWFALGLAGLIMLLLWVATDHAPTKYNWNILWALPTHLLFFWRSKRGEWTENYAMVTGALAMLVLLFWGFIPQNLPEAALPIVVLVVIKAFFRRYWKQAPAGEIA